MGDSKEKLERGQTRRNAVPSWRQVEALRERRALKAALADIWSEDPDLDESIFFTESPESRRFYQRPASLKAEDFEVDDDLEPDDEA